MRGRRETTHTAPRFFSRLPRAPSTLFPFPSTVQRKKKEKITEDEDFSSCKGRLRGKRNGSGEGAGGAREKLLGPYLVFPRPSCIAFHVFELNDFELNATTHKNSIADTMKYA
jgi:hypothetical protein